MSDDFTEPDSKLAHYAGRFAVFNKLREANELCDVTLIVEGRRLKAHRVVLSAGSPYFCKMFTLSMLETNLEEINMPEINYETMEQVIQFLYTSRVKLTTDNSQNILIAANFLQMLDLVELCGKYVVRQIDATNCFLLRDLLKTTNCDEKIIARANEYINKNVVQITENDSFLQLDINSVVELLSSTEVCCESEEDVVHSAIKWLNADSERNIYAQQIYNCIRLPLLSDTFKAAFIERNPLFNDVAIAKNSNLIFTPRTTKTTLVTLNHSENMLRFMNQPISKKSINYYNSIAKEWTKLMDVEEKFYSFLAADCDHLVLCGPENESCTSYFFDLFNLKTEQWTSLPSLERRDRNINTPVELLFVGCRIYLFGATHRLGGLSDTLHVAVYDMENGSWTEELQFSTSGIAKYLVVDKNIYILDKISYNGRIRKFDTETQTLDDGRVVKGQRSFTQATAYKGKIYFFDSNLLSLGPDHPKTFKVYDPVTNETKELASIRFLYYLFATSDGIYALRGPEDRDPYKLEMEFYDVENNEWHYVSTMPQNLEHRLISTMPSVFCHQ